jgi:flagellar hook-associated protein 2
MSTSGINSLLSSLGSLSTAQNPTGISSSNLAVPAALQTAVNAILNSATSTSGSGIDVQSTVDAILQIKSAPQQLLQQQETTLNTQSEALKTIEADLEAFETSVNAVGDFFGAFGALGVTSTNNNVVSATAANGTALGMHTILVSHLATTSASYSVAVSSGDAQIPAGSFDLQVGTQEAVTIPVDSTNGTDTLNGLADYINQQDLGVTASVINDTSGARLALVSQTSGAAGVLTLSNDTTGTNGNGMGFTQAVDGSGNPLGTDASLTVDGIPITAASNTVSGVIPGVTLTLSGESASPVTIGIQPDYTQVGTAINNFITSYNQVIKDINTQSQVDSSTNTAGPLVGDSALALVQQQLLSGIASNIPGNNGVVNLESIGISMQDDGTLTVNSNTLNDALINNFSAVQNLFQSTSPAGIATILKQELTWLTDATQGPLNVDMKGISQQVSGLNSQISDFQYQLQNTQKQLLAEYTQINTTLEQLPQMIAQINAQLDALNPQKSS